MKTQSCQPRSQRARAHSARVLAGAVAITFTIIAAACTDTGPTGPARVAYASLSAAPVWDLAINAELVAGTSSQFNTASLDGCPFQAPDGKSFYMASNRSGLGAQGGIDIWVSKRASTDDPWGAPVNAGPPVNSAANDFCPTMSRDGRTFFFVSNRQISGACGGDDIYVTHLLDDGTFEDPVNLGCAVNSAGNEAGPFPLTEPGSGPVLYFSSTRAGGVTQEAPGVLTGDADIYRSEWHGSAYGPATLVPSVNSAGQDIQPNLQRDGVEIYFASNRAGTAGTTGTLGGMDIFVATRPNAHYSWSTPMDLGSNVNSTNGDETRPSLSWDAMTLYFGSNRPGAGEGASDIFVSHRIQ